MTVRMDREATHEHSDIRCQYLLIFLIATSVRLVFVWGQTRFGWFDISFLAGDSHLYVALAESLVRGQGFSIHGHPTAYVTPGYPLFLATLYAAGLSNSLVVGLVQAVLGGVTCVLIGRIANLVGGPRVALWAGLLGAVYPHFIFWTGYVLTETLFVFCVVVSLLNLAWLSVRLSAFRAVGCGLLLGVAALVRPVMLGFAVMVPLWLLWMPRTPFLRRLLLATLLSCAMAILLLPWAVRNSMTLGSPVFTSTESGVVFYQGNSAGSTGGSRGYVSNEDYTPLAMPPDVSEVEVNRYHWQKSMEFLLAHPEAIPTLFIRKLANMWRPTYGGASWRNRVVLGGSYLCLMIFGAFGVAQSVRHGLPSPSTLILFVFIATFVVQHGVVTGMIRFRLPVEAAITVFAAIGLNSGVSIIRGFFRGSATVLDVKGCARN